MSWIDKELKKRAAAASELPPPPTQPAPSAAEQVSALWTRIAAANEALPAELRLRAETAPPSLAAARGMPPIKAWLVATNGAALGRTADGIRYFWPRPSKKRSHNFWIRWKSPAGYTLQQRAGSSPTGPTFLESRFDESRIDHLVECLVTGRLVKLRALRKKRFGLF